jgi:CNT family concentrative nucleoside transporter
MVPERREEVLALGLRSLVSGTLATLVTAATVGIVLPS